MGIAYSEVNLEILRRLWDEAMQVQDACNGTGVASGMHNAMSKLMSLYQDTTAVNRHPITKMWLLKMMDLANIIAPLMEYADTVDEWQTMEQQFVNALANIEIANAETEDAV